MILKELKEAFDEDEDFSNVIKACLSAVNQTINDKVLKVVTQSLSLFSILIKSKELDEPGC